MKEPFNYEEIDENDDNDDNEFKVTMKKVNNILQKIVMTPFIIIYSILYIIIYLFVFIFYLIKSLF